MKTPILPVRPVFPHVPPDSCFPPRHATQVCHRNTGRVGYEDLVPWDYTHTLAGELSKAGYYTQCVGKMHVHPLRNNLGFNDVRLHDGYRSCLPPPHYAQL